MFTPPIPNQQQCNKRPSANANVPPPAHAAYAPAPTNGDIRQRKTYNACNVLFALMPPACQRRPTSVGFVQTIRESAPRYMAMPLR